MTAPYDGPSVDAARALITRATCLLVDFDGPICKLFAVNRPERVAGLMHRYMADRAERFGDPRLAGSEDPHGMLAALAPGALAAGLEALLAEEEEIAAHSARPTEGAETFLRLASDSGRRLAITTNNSAGAVETYLKEHALDGYFGRYVFGRDPGDPARMKPDPDCLVRAADALGARRADCLMIGDSPRDADAAQRAAIPFLGFARDARQRERMAEDHPEAPVVDMPGLILATERARHSDG